MSRVNLLVRLAAVMLMGLIALSTRAQTPLAIDPPFPAWVFGHVVWEDESTTQSVYDLVAGYQQRHIPVDAVIIDSPWETAYNTFDYDPKRFPDFPKLVADLHAQNIKVIIWITCMVNTEDPEYQSCLEKGYFVKGMEARKWWKGVGGMIDYNNPAAMAWWHARLNKVIDLGLDGWKVDGTDPLMLYRGWGARQRYATQYYSDFYDYTRQHSGRKTVIMARPMEQGVNESLLRLPDWTNPLGWGVWLRFAPVDRSFASWVGDQDPTFNGLTIARRHILRSARENYLILGSDIGGYRGPGPKKELLIRWAQFGAFCPFMENGGIGEHRPWQFDLETTKIYRAYVRLHEALRFYLYTEAIAAWQAKKSLITPLGIGKDEYLLGRDVLVAPIPKAGGKVKVTLPAGHDWMPLFADKLGADAAKCAVVDSKPLLLKGGCSFTHTYGLAEFPVFLRAGAVIPWQTTVSPGLYGNYPCALEHERLLLAVPTAGASQIPLDLVVYEEGRAPIKFSGQLQVGDYALEANGETWPIFIPGPSFPAIPEE